MPKSIWQKSPDVVSCPHECFRFEHSLRRHDNASFGRYRIDQRHRTSIDGRYAQWFERDRCDVNDPRKCFCLNNLYNSRNDDMIVPPRRRDTEKLGPFAERGGAIGFHSSDRSPRDEIIPSQTINRGDRRITPTESRQRARAMRFYSFNARRGQGQLVNTSGTFTIGVPLEKPYKSDGDGTLSAGPHRSVKSLSQYTHTSTLLSRSTQTPTSISQSTQTPSSVSQTPQNPTSNYEYHV